MLFRTYNGQLVDIRRENYLNNRDYYRAVLDKVYGIKLPIQSINNYLSIS